MLTSDYHNWIFNRWTNQINFKIAATSDIAPGLYWIEWTIEETKGSCNTYYFEAFSQRTLVEIPELKQFGLEAKFPAFYKSDKSHPIGVTLEKAPAEELILSLTVEDSNFIVYPEELVFSPEIRTLYFIVNTTDSAESTIMSLTTSGVSGDSYVSAYDFTLQVLDKPSSNSASQINIESQLLSGNSMKITVSGNQDGLLYYWLQCGSNFNEYTVSELLGLIGELQDWYDYEPIYEYRKNAYKNIDLDEFATDIIGHFLLQYRIHCENVYISAVPYFSDEGFSITFDWLYTESDYTFSILLDSKTEDPVYSGISFTTSPTPSLYTIDLTVPADISEQINDIECLLAQDLQIPVQYLLIYDNSNDFSRRLETTSIE